MAPSDVTAQAFQRALLAERRRNARTGAWVRFVSISLFLALVLVRGVILGLPGWQGHLHVLVPYWLLTIGLLVVGSRSEWLRQHGGIAIALLDMPVVFLLLRGFVAAFPDNQDGPATFGLALMIPRLRGDGAARGVGHRLRAGGDARSPRARAAARELRARLRPERPRVSRWNAPRGCSP
jgi:hypothetical protein